ncbi:MAG: DUF4179 domain-containing protein [Bacillus sp. (in: Bacteria)]|nr:DUF4179 domain-containing protein [Bacillus sp. (in: firmicutes)]
MEKKLFQEHYEKIDVPKEDVLNAIKIGVKRAHSSDNPRKKRVFVFSTVAAAIMFISSSLIFPSMSKVMADVPLVGQIYVNFNDLVGRNLASQKLITQLNETANSKGIDVKITSAYYDGAVIGVTFDVVGKVTPDNDGRLMGIYEIFDGDKDISDSKELVDMEPINNGYTGHIQLNYPKLALPEDTTFPLEFKSIGEKDGSWKFDVPIKQLAFETFTVDKESASDDVLIHFDSLITGKASTAINYTATFPSKGKHDQVRLEVFDDQGKPIQLLSDGIDLETKKVGNQIIVKGRTIIPESLRGKTSYLDIRPMVALSEPDQFVSLNEQTPKQIKSDRQNLSVTIEKISLKDKSLAIDFQVNNGEKTNKEFMFFQDFARTNVTLVKESEKEVYEEAMRHSVTVLDKEKLRYRSTFDLSKQDEFHSDKYLVRVNLDSLSANMPLELEPVKLGLK